MTTAHVRDVLRADEPVLWRALAWAAHMPGDGNEEDVRGAQAEPDLARYVASFGRAGDAGVIDVVDGEATGAAWYRLMQGYGFVRPDVPELSIGVAPGWRNRGVGTRLLSALLPRALAQHEAISLSVRLDNPALRLYRRFGFEILDGTQITNRAGTESVTMLLSLA